MILGSNFSELGWSDGANLGDLFVLIWFWWPTGAKIQNKYQNVAWTTSKNESQIQQSRCRFLYFVDIIVRFIFQHPSGMHDVRFWGLSSTIVRRLFDICLKSLEFLKNATPSNANT